MKVLCESCAYSGGSVCRASGHMILLGHKRCPVYVSSEYRLECLKSATCYHLKRFGRWSLRLLLLSLSISVVAAVVTFAFRSVILTLSKYCA